MSASDMYPSLEASMANTGVARGEYQKNKTTQQYCSKAKGLLYGGDSKPATPLHSGKKSVPHAGDHGGAPFALWTGEALAAVETVQGGQLHKTFQARHAKKEGAGKVSSMTHDVDVYRSQLIMNAANLAREKTKARGSAGLLGQHPMTPPPAAAAGSKLRSGYATPQVLDGLEPSDGHALPEGAGFHD